MAGLGNMAAELSKGKNLERNLPNYAAGMNALFHRVGNIKLALNIYTFSQIYGEDMGYTESVKEYADRLTVIIKKAILQGEDRKEAEQAIEAMRNELIGRMEILTSYVDQFQIYEYVLNRIEYNYEESDVNLDYYSGKFEKDLMNYVISNKDNTVINMKIGQIVGQLPMRLSKNKFFELLHNAFTLYQGADMKSASDFVYMVNSVAMLNVPENFETAFPFLWESLKILRGYKYEGISEAEYHDAAENLAEATEYVNQLTDMFVLLMETLNDAYTCILSEKSAVADMNERKNSHGIINEAVTAIEKKDLPTEEIFESFIAVEGIQEKLFMQLSSDGYALDDVKNSYMKKVEEAGLSEIYEDLFKMNLLNSGSNFVVLSEGMTEQTLADENYINMQYDTVSKALMNFFENHERMVNRAVMAGILSGLPSFFNNTEDIKKYIHVALNQCQSDAEKKACMTLMLSLMNEE